MKILMINTVCGIKSTGRICTDLALSLESQGHTVKIAYGRGEVPQPFQRFGVSIGAPWGPYAHALQARLLDSAAMGSAAATENFLRWVREFDPDIIHLHNVHGYYIHAGMLFSYLKDSGKRVIWTLHDMWPFTGHSATCDEKSCFRWREGCHHCPLKRVYPASLTDFSRRNWQWKKNAFQGIPHMTIITPSRWLAGLVRESFLKDYPVKVIPNGIDTRVFSPEPGHFRKEQGLEGKKIVLGVAGSWTDSKGWSDFLKLPELLGEQYQVVMVGVSERQQRQLPPGILGITQTSSARELARIYSDADLLLNLTYCDNYPTVNMEALCCGTPVLTYRTGGSPENIPQGMGASVDRGDLEGICREIPRLLYADVKAQVLSQTEQLRSRFGKEAAVEAYLRLYEGSVD